MFLKVCIFSQGTNLRCYPFQRPSQPVSSCFPGLQEVDKNGDGEIDFQDSGSLVTRLSSPGVDVNFLVFPRCSLAVFGSTLNQLYTVSLNTFSFA